MSSSRKNTRKNNHHSAQKATKAQAQKNSPVTENEKSTVDAKGKAGEKGAAQAANKIQAGNQALDKTAQQETTNIQTDNNNEQKTDKLKKTPTAKDERNKSSEKAREKPQTPPRKAHSTVPRKPKPIVKAPPEPTRKKGSLGIALALILGIAGTGLGAYAFNELRLLKGQQDSIADTQAQLGKLSQKVGQVEKDKQTAHNKKQLANLAKQQATLKAAEQHLNQRISKVEQMQKRLSNSVATDIDSALKARLGAVDALLAKIKDIELGQQGLSKNIHQAGSGSQVMNETAMKRQEVGYLLRMANYKVESEGDVIAATGLLKMAENQLLAVNQGQNNALINAIRDKLIQLSGVKRIDSNALISQLTTIAQAIPKLVVKSNKTKTVDADKNTGKPQEDDKQPGQKKSMLGKIGAVLASGVKYTPKDPSKIDISAETALIEKRLMQADIKTAEFAIRSHNKVLLAQSIQSLRESLDSYFAQDETAAVINDQLTQLSNSQLQAVLPDLSSLVKQFQAAQKTQ